MPIVIDTQNDLNASFIVKSLSGVGSQIIKPTIVPSSSSPYSVLSTDNLLLFGTVQQDVGRSISLPDPSASIGGKILTINNSFSTISQKITITSNLDGVANQLIYKNEVLTLFCDGTKWITLNYHYPEKVKYFTTSTYDATDETCIIANVTAQATKTVNLPSVVNFSPRRNLVIKCIGPNGHMHVSSPSGDNMDDSPSDFQFNANHGVVMRSYYDGNGFRYIKLLTA